MQVRKVNLNNYRNYNQVEVHLTPGKNILIGDNAQGKSNFLEAIEVASRGKSARTSEDVELIHWHQARMQLEVVFERSSYDESIGITLVRAGTNGSSRLDKRVNINGVKPPTARALFGKLVTVTFSTQDLSMLRDGPKFRRQWIDTILFSLTPSYQDTLLTYQKVVTQRNKLLKTMFERGRISVSDQDQLHVWDKQLAHYGSTIIKNRMRILHELLPLAETYQSHLSKKTEVLTANYIFKSPNESSSEAYGDYAVDDLAKMPVETFPESSEAEIAQTIMTLLRKVRGAEIARRQTLLGPHRDDISFAINGASALSFASQGQQRSLVLSLKLAELDLVTEKLAESPVLLLDDVLAELDVDRQGLLMSALNKPTQTIITTTHLSRFEPQWLAGAKVFSVDAGHVGEAEAAELR